MKNEPVHWKEADGKNCYVGELGIVGVIRLEPAK
jgi:hypothetical protein